MRAVPRTAARPTAARPTLTDTDPPLRTPTDPPNTTGLLPHHRTTALRMADRLTAPRTDTDTDLGLDLDLSFPHWDIPPTAGPRPHTDRPPRCPRPRVAPGPSRRSGAVLCRTPCSPNPNRSRWPPW